MIRYGTSWRGRRPGVRHWVSVPVGPLGCALLVPAAMFWLAAWGVIAMAWIAAEAAAFTVSGGIVLAQLIERQGRPEHVTVIRLPFGLLAFALRPPPP